MKLQSQSLSSRRGSALLMAVMVLMVVTAIAAQLFIGTHTDARVARNDVALTTMDLAIESAMLEVFETLALDGEEAAASGAGAADPGAVPGAAAAPGGAGEQQPATDSREDEWGRVQRTEINGIELRILVQDEDSKLNVLGMLTENEDEADLHFERLVRVLDFCREGTSEDIDASDARRMVEAMRTHMLERSTSVTPMPELATKDDEKPDLGLPISLKEFEVLDPFNEGMFRDYRGEHGEVVHSIGSFLTVWTSLETGSAEGGSEAGSGAPGSGAGSGSGAAPESGAGAGEPSGLPNESELGAGSGEVEVSGSPGQGRGSGGSGSGEPGTSAGGGESGAGGGGGGGGGAATGGAFGVAVNVNTAPAAVLKALIDDRDVPGRWWDRVIEYRNLEEELEAGQEQPEPVYDEYGNEIIQRRVFDGLEELEEIPGTTEMLTAERARINQLLTTQSQVFSIFITARKATGQQRDFGGYRGARRDEDEKEDLKGNTLTRTVRAVVWRTTVGEKVMIVPLIRWEVLDYTPFEVEDYPDEDR